MTLVGTIRQVDANRATIATRCVDGQGNAQAERAYPLTAAPKVEIPTGDYASGAGHVSNGSINDLENPAYDTWEWQVDIRDGQVVSVVPWFLEGCTP